MRKTQSVVVQNTSTKRPLGKRNQTKKKKQEAKSDPNRDVMQTAITILKKRKNSETKFNDQFDNYGKYIACQFRGMQD